MHSWKHKPKIKFELNGLLCLLFLQMSAADDIHNYFFHCFSEKIRLDVSSESPARQRIHMKKKTKPYFLRKIKVKKIKISSAAIFV